MRTLWKRLVCLFTLNHIDPAVRVEGNRMHCKKCDADVGGLHVPKPAPWPAPPSREQLDEHIASLPPRAAGYVRREIQAKTGRPYLGARDAADVPDTAQCPACGGYGRVNDGSGARSPYGPKCPTCGGSGRVPAGVQEVPRG